MTLSHVFCRGYGPRWQKKVNPNQILQKHVSSLPTPSEKKIHGLMKMHVWCKNNTAQQEKNTSATVKHGGVSVRQLFF